MIRYCKYGEHDAFIHPIDDSDLDLNGHKVPDDAAYWHVTRKPDGKGKARYLVTGFEVHASKNVTAF